MSLQYHQLHDESAPLSHQMEICDSDLHPESWNVTLGKMFDTQTGGVLRTILSHLPSRVRLQTPTPKVCTTRQDQLLSWFLHGRRLLRHPAGIRLNPAGRINRKINSISRPRFPQ